MLHRPDLGFSDQGRDLAAPEFYASVFHPPGKARVLPPTVFRSLAYAALEDDAVWSQSWVGAGSQADIPEIGDLLPYTVGTHGLHIQRMPEGLAARFNKAQHGGCRTVPVQCQQGTKTRCSFTSCGYSRDRAAIPAGEFGDGAPEMHQYLGLRPERLFTAHACAWGPLIFVSLAEAPRPMDVQLAALGPASRAFGPQRQARTGQRWLEFAANWKLALEALVVGAPLDTGERDWLSSETTLRCRRNALVYALFPNVVLLITATETCAVILQPTALDRTLCRVSVWGDESRLPLIDWPAEIVARGVDAEQRQVEKAQWGTAHAPHTLRQDPPVEHAAHVLWWQRALAHRVLARPQLAADLPVYDNRKASGR